MDEEVIKHCAIYTRKSTEEGLDQEFNTLDAQREAAEAYILSQHNAGWVTMAERYDDGGFTGGNTSRPGLQRLLADIKAGKVNCVVVYKVDRLSRSLLDFAQMMEVFDLFHVGFVAVTQQINTASSAGRLMLNVLLSFAQFERELISERTRDKMGAARRKGKWLGSSPILGYDVDRDARRLVINPEEEHRVRQIFELYLESDSLLAVVRELRQRCWLNKKWQTKRGDFRGGRAITKSTLQLMLRNVTYIGKVSYRGDVYPGEHDAIVTDACFEAVQQKLKANRHAQNPKRGPRSQGSLQGKLYCGSCRSKMTHTYTNKGKRRYRYYVCARANQSGKEPCQNSIPAAEIEKYVRAQTEEFSGGNSLNLQEDATLGISRVEYHGELGDLKIQYDANPRTAP